MNRTLVTLLVVGASLATLRAGIIDNFDSYDSKAEFDAVWTPSTGTGLGLNTSVFDSSPNSVMNPGTTAQVSRQFMTPISAPILSVSFDFYDFDAGNARDYVAVQSRVGTEYTGALNNLLAIGKYNSIAGAKYYGRVSTATGAVYGDGASAPVSTWFHLDGAANMSIGWHNAKILGLDSTAYVGKVRYEFYIDDVLGGSVDNLDSVDYNWVLLGSGLSTAPSGLAFDNLAVVPEPSSLALVLLGGFGLFVRRIRRQ